MENDDRGDEQGDELMDHSEILKRLRVTFHAEATDLLSELGDALLALEADAGNPDLVNRVFRALHTIKGSGATCGFQRLSGFAHKVEEVFNLAREGKLDITPALIDQALRACDVLGELLKDGDATAGLHAVLEGEIVAALSTFLPATSAAGSVASKSLPAPQSRACRRAFCVEFRPTQRIFFSGNDPISLLAELAEMGQARVTAHLENVPPLDELDPELCYAWWEIAVSTERSEQQLREIFLFVEGEGELSIRCRDDGVGPNPTDLLPADSAELFLCEGREQLQVIDERLLLLEKDPGSSDHLGGVFRALHSIKGNAGLLLSSSSVEVPPEHPLRVFQRVAHFAESLVERQPSESSPAHWKVNVQALMEAADTLTGLLAAIDNRQPSPPLPESLARQLGTMPASGPNQALAENPQSVAFLNTARQCLENMSGCLAEVSGQAPFAGDRIKSFLRSWRTLSAASKYLDYPDLRQELASQSRLLDQLTASEASASGDDLHALKASFSRIDRLVKEIEDAFKRPARVAASPVTSSDQTTEVRFRAHDTGAQSIRVDQEKLDRLMRVTSELLVARGALPVLSQKLDREYKLTAAAKELKDASADISRVAEELQATVMSIRMIPISTVFQRFSRLVRDLARGMEKEIEISFQGEDTELDKTVVQIIGDPLVHLVRNAADHGIERPDRRQEQGKSRAGHILLRAYQESNHVAIEVIDDGKGLDAGLLKQKAVEKGMITANAAAVMSEKEAYQLIFAAGLSTADQVTDVSGRGVGMDVVINNIQKLKGTVGIESKPGCGTTIRIKLPTNVMITKGILVAAGDLEFIVPIDRIHDMVQVLSESVHSHNQQRLLHAKGRVHPLVSLSEYFGSENRMRSNGEACVVLIEASPSTYGLIVDRFVSEVEVMVKRLTGGLEGREDLLGAAIMGDGRVVLVLDPAFDFVAASAVA